ncbi:hypothetical protein COO60DRAFT_1586595, partial [Scenedesmus sp. NREL 46B-D3]
NISCCLSTPYVVGLLARALLVLGCWWSRLMHPYAARIKKRCQYCSMLCWPHLPASVSMRRLQRAVAAARLCFQVPMHTLQRWRSDHMVNDYTCAMCTAGVQCAPWHVVPIHDGYAAGLTSRELSRKSPRSCIRL